VHDDFDNFPSLFYAISAPFLHTLKGTIEQMENVSNEVYIQFAIGTYQTLVKSIRRTRKCSHGQNKKTRGSKNKNKIRYSRDFEIIENRSKIVNRKMSIALLEKIITSSVPRGDAKNTATFDFPEQSAL